MGKRLVIVLCTLFCGSLLMAADSQEKVFDGLDRNGDNALSKEEFMAGKMEIDRDKAIKLFPGLSDVKEVNEWELRERLFVQMDGNRDGILTRDEWNRVAPNILIIRF